MPQVATSVFEAHAVPHGCWPFGQVKPQMPFVQVAVAPAGAVQSGAVQQFAIAMHAVPHGLKPVWQVPEHAIASSMHEP